MIIYDETLKIYTSTLLANFFSGFSTKPLGDGMDPLAVAKFLNDNNKLYKTLVVLGQKHTVNVHYYEPSAHEDSIKVENMDGVITKSPSIMLTVRTADCSPIIFADEEAGIVGVSHQGWKGTYEKLTVKMIDEMVAHGARKEKIVCAIGPTIGSCCYAIDEERTLLFKTRFPQFTKDILTESNGNSYLNLTKLQYLLLVNNGVSKNNIDFFPFCTKCNEEKFFSFRREGKQLSGEMFSFIMKENV